MLYHIYLDGWRYAALFYKGRKHAKLLIIATLETHKILVRDLDKLKEVKGKTLAKARIKERKALYESVGLPYPKKAVKLALRGLE